MPFDLGSKEKAPEGLRINDVVNTLRTASHDWQPNPKMPPPMNTIKVRSLSSRNQTIDIGSQQVKFNDAGEAFVDARFRQEVEHHCNLRQGFFSIVEEQTTLPEVVVNGESPELYAKLDFADLAQILANFLAVATEEEKLVLVELTDVAEIATHLEAVMDRAAPAPVETRIDGDDLQVEVPARVVTEDDNPQDRTEEQSEDEQDPLELLAAVERGEMQISETGEVTKVEKRGRGRPPKTAKP